MNEGSAGAPERLRRAQALHSLSQIAAALIEARRAIDLDPTYVEAWTYLGTTLVTRHLAFGEGLAALERAATLAPDDASVNYSLGWCYEFVAYRLERQAARPFRDPVELYALAADRLRRCIDLEPEAGLEADARDLLNSILDRL